MPTAGERICTSGHPNISAAAALVVDATAALPPPLDLPGIFSIILTAIGVINLVTSDFCAAPPVYPGDPTLDDLIAWGESVLNQPAIEQKYIQLILYALWPQVCICDTYVPPNVSWPAPPANPSSTLVLPSQGNPLDLTCNLSAITGKLNAILGLLNLIAATVGPHSYSLGPTHTVSGIGELTVSGIIGVVTHALAYRPGVGYDASDPVRFYDAGWISFGDGNGWYSHNRNIMDPQFHVGAPTGTTKVAFDCQMVASMEITELLPSVIYQAS